LSWRGFLFFFFFNVQSIGGAPVFQPPKEKATTNVLSVKYVSALRCLRFAFFFSSCYLVFRFLIVEHFYFSLGTLDQAVEMATGDPLFCKNCNAVFSIVRLGCFSLSVPSSIDVFSFQQCGKEQSESVRVEVWVLWYSQRMCSRSWRSKNSLSLSFFMFFDFSSFSQIPTSKTTDYILEPPKDNTVSSDSPFIIFCIGNSLFFFAEIQTIQLKTTMCFWKKKDISGSMCVTTEVAGNLKLKGSHLHKLESLNPERENQ
jgi:hypothetical protein